MAQTLTSGPSRAFLLDFFTRALTSFQESQHPFHVVCSLPRPGTAPGAPSTAGTQPMPTPTPSKPTSPVGRVVVLDSSFNPPTLAHMGMASSAARTYAKKAAAAGGPEASSSSDTRVLLLLSVRNADKAAKPASFPQRLAMMYVFAGELLAKGQDGVEVVDIGLCTMPYFHDKCDAIEREGFYSAAGRSPEQIYLAGYDTLIRIFNPKYYGQGAAAGPSMQAALGPFFDRARLRITLRQGAEWGGDVEQGGQAGWGR
ncbi:hypothetical protein jhhlp_008066 [Lomentospora prolificans]|uniref:Cytidyltransferase-like domain-containing protein n=1 Tax=Lomentospora prolificans TaxID=41688 RepID=A0A2N3MZE9_9PEZI|nr:hypothetical protein jhhlp_008066 [Lomentospora prolificans]